MSGKHDEKKPLRALAPSASDCVPVTRQHAHDDLVSTQEALRQTKESMERMLESLTDGFCAVDTGWRVTYINARALELLSPLHKSRERVLGRSIWDELPELCGSAIETEFRRAMASQQTLSFEFYYPLLKCWFDLRVYPSEEGLTSYIQDITRRKADEKALLDGSNRLQVALSAGRLGDWRWDALSDRVTLGARAAEIFGLPAETPLIWPQLRARLVDTDRAMARSEFLQAFVQHTDLNIECRIERPGCGQCWVAIVGRGDYDNHNNVLGMTGVLQDISTRKSAEDTLRQSEEVLRALANSIPQLAWMAQADGAIVWFNKRWYEYTGTTPDQVVGWGWQMTQDPEVLPQMLQRWHASIDTGDPFEMEFPIRGADGQYRWFLTRVSAVRDRHGKVLRWFGTNTDVDQVKRVQQALREESNVLELLNSTGSALASQRDLRSLLQGVTDAATGVSGARFGVFFYNGKDSDGDLFTLYTLAGTAPPEFGRFGQPHAVELFGLSLRGERVVRSNDITQD
ncbi:MAG: PAS domain-containing protein, partial [Telluria sp.]